MRTTLHIDDELLAEGRASQPRRPLAESLAVVQRLCVDEDFTLIVPKRRDRRNPFAGRR